MRFTRPGPCAATCTAGTLTCPRHGRRDPLVNVTPSRLRAGELVAGSGAVILAVSLLLPWYDVAAPGAHESGLRAVGWPALIVLVLAVLAGVGVVVTTLTEVTPARPLAVAVVAVPLGLLAVLVVIFRLVAEPGLGVGASDGEVAVEWPAFAGLVGSVAIVAGAWIAIADERTGTALSRAQTERALAVRGAPRAVPPPRDPS